MAAMNSLSHILERRIDEKKRDFALYNFKQTENNALTTFFRSCAGTRQHRGFLHPLRGHPKGFFDCDAKLHLIDPKTNDLTLTASTENADRPFHPILP